jgi:hypothetical protein
MIARLLAATAVAIALSLLIAVGTASAASTDDPDSQASLSALQVEIPVFFPSPPPVGTLAVCPVTRQLVTVRETTPSALWNGWIAYFASVDAWAQFIGAPDLYAREVLEDQALFEDALVDEVSTSGKPDRADDEYLREMGPEKDADPRRQENAKENVADLSDRLDRTRRPMPLP